MTIGSDNNSVKINQENENNKNKYENNQKKQQKWEISKRNDFYIIEIPDEKK